MHFQYLVEDQSGAALIRILMQKIVELFTQMQRMIAKVFEGSVDSQEKIR